MKLNANWIIESHDEYCPLCRERKGGRFLVIYLDEAGYKKYVAICEECLKE